MRSVPNRALPRPDHQLSCDLKIPHQPFLTGSNFAGHVDIKTGYLDIGASQLPRSNHKSQQSRTETNKKRNEGNRNLVYYIITLAELTILRRHRMFALSLSVNILFEVVVLKNASCSHAKACRDARLLGSLVWRGDWSKKDPSCGWVTLAPYGFMT